MHSSRTSLGTITNSVTFSKNLHQDIVAPKTSNSRIGAIELEYTMVWYYCMLHDS